jgi:hypothetical protein
MVGRTERMGDGRAARVGARGSTAAADRSAPQSAVAGGRWGSSPAPRATHVRGPVEVLLWPLTETPQMREWGMVVARRRPEATHAPVGAVPTTLSDFF